MRRERTVIKDGDKELQDSDYVLCIDESAGSGEYHRHNYGHDFPMTLEELIILRDQIDKVIKGVK